MPHGLLVLDKPEGMPSRAALDRAQRWFARRTRMGHAGTLDPLATGVLVLCLGSATRLVEHVQRMAKTYHSIFRLGARSDTDDADGAVTVVPEAEDPGADRIAEVLRSFVGTVEQVPPAYSAIKVEGRRAYDIVRGGKEVSLRARPVCIHGIDVLRYQYPEVEVEVRCGKGTYIRAIARDAGEKLGCGAFVQTLRRTCIGPFTIEKAVSLQADAATARAALLPPVLAVSDLPRLVLAQPDRERLRNGQAVILPGVVPACQAEVAVLDEMGSLAAVAEVDAGGRLLRPGKVFV
jgi:tRNA pseudouridine55 synthase